MADIEDDGPELEAWRRAGRSLQIDGSDKCPDPGQLAELVIMGAGGAGGSGALADHIVSCRRCLPAYRSLLALHGHAATELKESGAPRSHRWMRSVAAAAVLIIGAGVSWVLWRERITPREESADRSAQPESLALEQTPSEPPDLARIASPPPRFSWSAEPGADVYWVVLYDAASTVIWESPRVSQTHVVLPPEAGELLIAGEPSFWRVFWVEGLEQRQSPLRQFTLEP